MPDRPPIVNDPETGMPPLGVLLGPHPPCTNCGSQGFPADLEVSFRGRQAWVCLDCYYTLPAPIRGAMPVDRSKVLRLRQEPWTRSWRGWRRRSRDDAPSPDLVLP